MEATSKGKDPKQELNRNDMANFTQDLRFSLW
jgi:hypothetical protein